ncbi:hypothetical protein [Chryseobacterium scophthalmum]|uniref:hypothetical protein n=1 Tax=Chryseobacterium scophthalmum TaxID=59733 RepID=UPI003D06E9D1
MDTKYAFYSTSKGYRVLGGTAAHFLKADGSLDNTSYLTTDTIQNVTAVKSFITSGGSGWTNHALRITSNDGSNPGLTFYKTGVDAGVVNYDGLNDFRFRNSNDTASKFIFAQGYKKDGSDDNSFLTAGGGSVLRSTYPTITQADAKFVPYAGATSDLTLADKNLNFTTGSVSRVEGNTRIFNKVFQNYVNISQTGILSFKFPQATTAATMFDVTLKIYGYQNRFLGNIRVSFYKNNATSINGSGHKAVIECSDNFPTTVLNVGIDANGNVRINIGEATTVWSTYLTVEVERVSTSHSGYNFDWSKGWSQAIETDMSTYQSLLNIIPDIVATRSFIQNQNYFHTNTIVGQSVNSTAVTTLDSYLPNGGFISGYGTSGWGGSDAPSWASYGGFIKFNDNNGLQLYYNNGHNSSTNHRLGFRTKNTSNGTTVWYEFATREWSSTVNVPYTGATNDIHLNGKKLSGVNSVNVTQNSTGLYGSYVGLESKSSDGNTIYLGGVADSVGSYVGQSRYNTSNQYQSNKTYASFIKFGNAGDIYFYGNTGLTTNTNYTPTEIAKIDSTGKLTVQSIAKTSGLATQFLKADGSVDSSAYVTQVNLNTQLSNYVDIASNQNVSGVKKYTGAYSQWILNDDAVTNARGFLQSLSNMFYIGTLNDKNLVLYRNDMAKVTVGSSAVTFVDNIVIPNGTVNNHGVNLGQMNTAIAGHTHTFSSLTAKPTTATGYGITDVPRQGILGGDINSIRSNDTRNTNPLPSTDLKSGAWFDFKGVSTIGLTSSFSWASVMTFVPYSDDSGNANSAYRLAQSGDELSFQNYTPSGWGKWRKIWTNKHFSQTDINNWGTAFNWGNHDSVGYLTNSALSNYYTKNESLNLFVRSNGVETISDTKTFTHSPVIPNGTLDAHAVNVNQLNTKANGQENASAIGFSSGNIPTTDGGSFPYMYHSSGSYVALATQSYVQTNFLSTPNGTSVIISGSNLNDYLKTGFYRGVGLINAPFNNNGWWYVIIETHDSTWVTQKATSFGSGNIPNVTYQRTMNGGSWSDWAQVWTTQDFTTTNIQQWNYAYQYGLKVNETFSVNMSSGMAITDGILDNESGLTDLNEKNLVSAKRGYYYKYGSSIQGFEGLNYEYRKQKFGLGREINDTDKLTVEGSVKASKNFKSEGEKPDTLFIPNGELASLRDEIVNDQSDYAIRLDPHEYEIDPSGSLEVDDRNRLIHIIGEQVKMTVNFRRIYPKQQIVIYNFDQNGATMTVKIQGKTIANINARGFLRLYVTKSLRVIAERQQPCDFIW